MVETFFFLQKATFSHPSDSALFKDKITASKKGGKSPFFRKRADQ